MSISQKDLDQFIVLLGKHPLIVEDTIEIIELNASSNQPGGSVNESNQISSQYSISLTAEIKMLEISERIELTKKSGNYVTPQTKYFEQGALRMMVNMFQLFQIPES